MKELHKLESSWTYWYHSSNNTNWGVESYNKLITINSIEHFLMMTNYLNLKKLKKGYLFIMKDNILPIWESEDNKNGGCWSFKIPENKGFNILQLVLKYIIGCTITKDFNNYNLINGVSISFKKYFYIKIWLKKNTSNFNIFCRDFVNLIKKLDIIKLYKAYKK